MRSAIVILISISCVSCTAVKEQSGRLLELDKYLQSQIPSNEPGAAVLIMKGDKVVFSKGYGVEDVSTKKPIDDQTLFNLGSISKTFVANVILILEEEGKLSVEDSLSKYFQFKNPEIGKRVKIKHLLNHTSGLPDNREVSKDTVFYLTAKDEENWAPVLKADSLQFEPGSRFEYSNPAFNALALIVEKVSGMKWQKFIDERIFDAAGMQSSTITDGPHPRSGVSHGYINVNGEWKEDDYGEEPTFAASGNGGVWSSTRELAQYEVAIRKADFLSAEKIKDARTAKNFPEWIEPSKPYIGWSWFITEKDGQQLVGHTGSQGGFLCNFQNIPEKKILVVILSNTPRDITAFTDTILKTLADNNWLE